MLVVLSLGERYRRLLLFLLEKGIGACCSFSWRKE